MPVVNSMPEGKTPMELVELQAGTKKELSVVLNFAKAMAHREGAMRQLFLFYAAAVDQGTIDPAHKQLAYLKASILNGCGY